MRNCKQTQLTKIITKLEERGVISKGHAKAARWLAGMSQSPLGRWVFRAIRFAAVKAIAELILSGRDNR